MCSCRTFLNLVGLMFLDWLSLQEVALQSQSQVPLRGAPLMHRKAERPKSCHVGATSVHISQELGIRLLGKTLQVHPHSEEESFDSDSQTQISTGNFKRKCIVFQDDITPQDSVSQVGGATSHIDSLASHDRDGDEGTVIEIEGKDHNADALTK